MNTDKLKKALDDGVDKLDGLQVGSEDYKSAIEALSKLTNSISDAEAKTEELILKKEQVKSEKRDKIAKNVLSGVGLTGELGVTVWLAKKSFKFDDFGSLTSTVGRSIIPSWFKKFKFHF